MSKLIQNLIRSLKVRLTFSNNLLGMEKGSSIAKSATISGCTLRGNIKIGEKAALRQSYLHGDISIGDYTTLNGPNLDIYAQYSPVTIGKFCSIARNVSIQSHNHNFDRISTYFINKNIFGEPESADVKAKGEVSIGNDVWIGTHSVVLSGASIGDGVIVGANSVVTGDLPDFAIAVGSPAKVIGYRFEEATIQLMREASWWNWPIEKIRENQHLFNIEDEEALRSALKAK